MGEQYATPFDAWLAKVGFNMSKGCSRQGYLAKKHKEGPPSRRLKIDYVGNIGHQEFKEILEQWGEVEGIKKPGGYGALSKGYAFVLYKEFKDAVRARICLDRLLVADSLTGTFKTLRVFYARPENELALPTEQFSVTSIA